MNNNYLIIIALFIFLLYKRSNTGKEYKKVIFINSWKRNDSLVYEEFMIALNNSHILMEAESFSLARDLQTKEMLKKYGIQNIDILPDFD